MRCKGRAVFVRISLVAACACGAPREVPRPGWAGWSDAAAGSRVPVRVAAWNVETLGVSGAEGRAAVATVLRRLDADVVALSEIEERDRGDLVGFAAELGYDTVIVDDNPPFGTLGNALLARLPVVDAAVVDASTLAGVEARDLTRNIVVVRVQEPGTGLEIAVVAAHLKSGFESVDVFRRAVDGLRLAQAADAVEAADLALVVGDLNAEPDEIVDPARWTEAPGDLPSSYRLGGDIVDVLRGPGVPGSPFVSLEKAGWRRLDLRQRDGDPGTRPTSGRVIDHVLVDARASRTPVRGEVYDCADDTPEQPGVADAGDPPAAAACPLASDHLPLVVELALPAVGAGE